MEDVGEVEYQEEAHTVVSKIPESHGQGGEKELGVLDILEAD